jgi:hypothetical protein
MGTPVKWCKVAMMPRSALRPRPALPFASALAVGAASLVLAGPARADEGQWMPSQIAELDQARLRELGLELAPPMEQLWSADGGLMRAAVNLNGCSAAFISADGLIATNHHCAYGAIQANSSVEHDYLKDGFVATRARGAAGQGRRRCGCSSASTDVTAQVQAAADAAPDDRARAQAIDRTRKQIVDDLREVGPALRCEVASFYSGSQYQRFTYRELRDVRLVYAPPVGDRRVRRRGRQLDVAAAHRRLLAAARVRGAGQRARRVTRGNVPYKPGAVAKDRRTRASSPGTSWGARLPRGRRSATCRSSRSSASSTRCSRGASTCTASGSPSSRRSARRDPAVGIKVAASKKSLANRHKNAAGHDRGAAGDGAGRASQGEEAALEQWAGRRTTRASPTCSGDPR